MLEMGKEDDRFFSYRYVPLLRECQSQVGIWDVFMKRDNLNLISKDKQVFTH